MREADLDRDRIIRMDGPARKQLKIALRAAFPTPKHLDQLLDGIDRSVADCTSDRDSMETVVFDVIVTAKAEGWLADLVAEAVETTRNETLHEFAAAYARGRALGDPAGDGGPARASGRGAVPARSAPAAAPSPAPAHPPESLPERYRRSSAAFFDLTTVEDAISDAYDTRRQLLGFATAYTDDMYLRVLLERIRLVFGITAAKTPLSLGPHLGTPDDGAAELLAYCPELRHHNVLCRVRIDRPASGELASPFHQFWTLLRTGVDDGAAHRLIVLFVGYPEMEPPAGVITLPNPTFTRHDVRTWTFAMLADHVENRNWPSNLHWAWRDQLCEAATDLATGIIHPRRLYRAIEDSVFELGDRPDDFRRRLEERAHAHPSQG